MTDEQLERGIELIKEMLAQREAGANAKVIEGVADGATHLKGASNEPARGDMEGAISSTLSAPGLPRDEWSPVCYGALDPPVGGTFHFENLIAIVTAKKP